MIKIPREETEFVTGVGVGAFMSLFPGQAQDSFTPGSKAYKVEIGLPPEAVTSDSAVVKAITTVAKAHDPENWERHIWGVAGKLKKLEETKRTSSKYPYYVGKYILSLSSVHSPSSCGMKDINLADPEMKRKYDQAIAARAPGVMRFAILPQDIPRIETENQKKINLGQTPYKESEYHKALITLSPHEVWDGCFIRVSGRAYWSVNAKPQTVQIALSQVLLVKTGEALFGEASPDETFGAFAPSEDFAPQKESALAGLL